MLKQRSLKKYKEKVFRGEINLVFFSESIKKMIKEKGVGNIELIRREVHI